MNTVSGRKGGQSFVELAAGLGLLIPVFLCLFDIAICFIADSANETVCRDAARAAAAGVPQKFTRSDGTTIEADAKDRAKAVVTRVYKSGGFIDGPFLMEDETGPKLRSGPPPPDPGAGGQWDGTYRVATKMVVKLPASIPGLTPTSITLTKVKDFEITRTEKPVYAF